MSDSTPLCLGCNQNGPGDNANDETLAVAWTRCCCTAGR